MNAKLFRYALAAAALTLAVGCGDSAGDDNNPNGDDNSANQNNTTPNNAANDSVSRRADLVEPDGCVPTLGMPNPTDPTSAEVAYLTATETELGTHRQEFGAFCGSVLPVDIDWDAMLSSRGFDDDEEIAAPGAVASAVTPFLNATQMYCNGRTPQFSETVSRVIITATDTDDRIGLCWDEATTTLVNRIKLTPDDNAGSTHWEGTEITDWLGENLD